MLTNKAFRYLRVGETLGDERENVDLTTGQVLGCIGHGVRARRGDQLDRGVERACAPLPPTPRRSGRSPNALRISASTRRDARESRPRRGTPSAVRIASAAARRRTARSASPIAAARNAADTSTSPPNQRSPNSTKSVSDSSNCAAAVSASPRSALMSATRPERLAVGATVADRRAGCRGSRRRATAQRRRRPPVS